MSKRKKLLLLAATLWPVVFFPLFFYFIFSTIIPAMSQTNATPATFFNIIFPIQAFLTLLNITLLLIYIMNVFNNTRVKKESKAWWAVAIFLGNTIGMLIYWYLYIWKTPRKNK